MSLLLAIEPDSSQADRLRQLVREKVNAELQVVTSAYAAIVAMNRQAPDVLLFGRSVAPRHQNTVLKHLRSLTEGDVPQVLTIPALSLNESAPPKASRFGFGWSRQPTIESPDPSRFADQIETSLAAAAKAQRRPATVMKTRAFEVPQPGDASDGVSDASSSDITQPLSADVEDNHDGRAVGDVESLRETVEQRDGSSTEDGDAYEPVDRFTSRAGRTAHADVAPEESAELEIDSLIDRLGVAPMALQYDETPGEVESRVGPR